MIVMGTQKTGMLIRLWTVKTELMRFSENEDSLESWIRGHLCYIIAKKLFIFFPCSQTFYKFEFKDERLIYLVKEISKYHSTHGDFS